MANIWTVRRFSILKSFIFNLRSNPLHRNFASHYFVFQATMALNSNSISNVIFIFNNNNKTPIIIHMQIKVWSTSLFIPINTESKFLGKMKNSWPFPRKILRVLRKKHHKNHFAALEACLTQKTEKNARN